MALTLEHFPKNAGVASGVVGVVQFGLGAFVSSIALSYHDGTIFQLELVFALFLVWHF